MTMTVSLKEYVELKETLKEAEDFKGFGNQNPSKCYDISYKFMSQMGIKGWKLVHAIIQRKDGSKFGHAWCEKGLAAFAATAGVAMDKESLYQLQGKVLYKVEYSFEEFIKESLDKEHSGPWDSKIDKDEYHN